MEPQYDSAVQDEAVDSKGRVADKRISGGWKACCYVLANEISDRIAFFAILANLVTYMTNVLHQNTAQAATNIYNWVGTIYMVTVLGGFLADAYWGRYRTIIAMAALYISGLLLLTVSSSMKSLRPPSCKASQTDTCAPASTNQLAFFFVALYLVALGSGCMKPCVSSFGADQFDENDSSEVKKKTSFFNWWFWGIHAGQLVAVTVLVYIQDNVGWSWGFGIPTVLMVISVVTFLRGTRTYRYQNPHGSPLTTIIKVTASAISKWNMTIPVTTDKGTKQISFLDRAALARSDKSSSVEHKKWNLCTRTQVEDTKVFVRILPMWFGTLLFSTVVTQNPTLFVKQGSTLDNTIHGKFKIPPASMLLFTNLTVLFAMPVYDRLFVPSVRKLTKHPRGITMLQRMGFGMFITVASMVAAGLVETKRLKVAREFPHLKPLPMTIFWLLPQYFLLGLAEVFTYSGQIEFFYDQAPASMRSLGAALQLTNLGAGSFLSSIVVTLVNRITNPRPWIQHSINQSHLNFFYWLLAALNVANIGVFIPLAVWFKYKDNEVLAPSMV